MKPRPMPAPAQPTPLARWQQAFRRGAFAECVRIAEEMLARSRKDAGAWALLGQAQLYAGHTAQALESLGQATRLKRDDAISWDALGLALRRSSRFAEAAEAHRKAVQLMPANPVLWINAAYCALDCQRPDEAARHARRAVALEATRPEAHQVLGIALGQQEQYPEAAAAYAQALRLRPAFEAARNSLAVVLYRLVKLGRFREAHPYYPLLLDQAPPEGPLWYSYLHGLTHDDVVSPEETRDAHQAYAARVEAPWRARWGGWENVPDPQRRLKIGFVSGDLRSHAVSYFIEPVWQSLPQEQFELYAYHSAPQEDATSERLRPAVAHWTRVHEMDDDQLEARIRADRIDILFDVSGHTFLNRLPVFARKPAPLQVSWIGYPNTTGLSAIDYRFVSGRATPRGEMDALFSEKLVRLHFANQFRPVDDPPPVAPPPVLQQGCFTFGCFQRIAKINGRSLALWVRVLQRLPEARMLVGAILEDSAEEDLRARFAAHGIGAERLILRRNTGLREYLELHGEVDLFLDTFPFTGGTTTYHALGMGVPTLTLAGRTLQQRQGATILAQNGFSEWIARDEEHFVELAVWAARRPPEEQLAYRLGMRERLAAAQARAALEADAGTALRLIWQRWCAGLPAAALDLYNVPGGEFH